MGPGHWDFWAMARWSSHVCLPGWTQEGIRSSLLCVCREGSVSWNGWFLICAADVRIQHKRWEEDQLCTLNDIGEVGSRVLLLPLGTYKGPPLWLHLKLLELSPYNFLPLKFLCTWSKLQTRNYTKLNDYNRKGQQLIAVTLLVGPCPHSLWSCWLTLTWSLASQKEPLMQGPWRYPDVLTKRKMA